MARFTVPLLLSHELSIIPYLPSQSSILICRPKAGPFILISRFNIVLSPGAHYLSLFRYFSLTSPAPVSIMIFTLSAMNAYFCLALSAHLRSFRRKRCTLSSSTCSKVDIMHWMYWRDSTLISVLRQISVLEETVERGGQCGRTRFMGV